MALNRETEKGLLTYAVTVRNQFWTSLSTLQAAVELREQLLRHQRDFYAGGSTVAADLLQRLVTWLRSNQPIVWRQAVRTRRYEIEV